MLELAEFFFKHIMFQYFTVSQIFGLVFFWFLHISIVFGTIMKTPTVPGSELGWLGNMFVILPIWVQFSSGHVGSL
jgi:hypothetical protein